MCHFPNINIVFHGYGKGSFREQLADKRSDDKAKNVLKDGAVHVQNSWLSCIKALKERKDVCNTNSNLLLMFWDYFAYLLSLVFDRKNYL